MLGPATWFSRNEGVSQSNTDLIRQQQSVGQSQTTRSLLDHSEVLRLPGNRSVVMYRSDILRYPVLATKVNYRAWYHLKWKGKYDKWPPKAVGSAAAEAARHSEMA